MKLTRFVMCALSVIAMSSAAAFAADAPKPKYGPEATLLSASHDYIQKHAAPDYWALSPYYLPQQTDSACSLASVTMVVNAARMGKKLTADDELATQNGVLKKAAQADWDKAVGDKGKGVSLDELPKLLEASLIAYGVDVVSVEAIHTPDSSKATAGKLHKALLANETSAHDFIIANFIQGVFTGDADVGHIAPVGAYDATNRRVLIMDPDRQWYEPYWVSEATFLKGMATSDKTSGKSRGYVVVRVK